MQIKILIVTHGQMGGEFVKTASDIIGSAGEIEFFPVTRDFSADEIKSSFSQLMEKLLSDSAVLILTDMLGGTPTNISMPFLENDSVEIVTGLNLPMLIRTIQRKTAVESLKELASIAAGAGAEGVVNCREVFNE
ncbi:MAG: PTS sugar transporter subunit IIA [Elusimicrobia bacterium]|nr:PTS sugar transporter subunit IIA [Elusimicrobiota bacterium]